MATRTDH